MDCTPNEEEEKKVNAGFSAKPRRLLGVLTELALNQRIFSA